MPQDEPEKKISKLSIILEPEVHRALKLRAIEGGTSIQRLMEVAASEIASGKAGNPVAEPASVHTSTPAPVDTKHAYWHNLLEAVLSSGNESAAVAIQRNLEVFAFTVSLAGQQTPDEFREMLDTFMSANAHAAERAPQKRIHKKAG